MKWENITEERRESRYTGKRNEGQRVGIHEFEGIGFTTYRRHHLAARRLRKMSDANHIADSVAGYAPAHDHFDHQRRNRMYHENRMNRRSCLDPDSINLNND